jgi:hypothetical protein
VWNTNSRSAESTLRKARTRARGPSGESVASIGSAQDGQRPFRPAAMRFHTSSSKAGSVCGSDPTGAAMGAVKEREEPLFIGSALVFNVTELPKFRGTVTAVGVRLPTNNSRPVGDLQRLPGFPAVAT